MMKRYISIALLAAAAGCTEKEQTVKDRWYTQGQVDSGSAIYKTNCLECHGEGARGTTPDWKQTLEDGSYPPPPLNGSAHAWHHPVSVLKRTIRDGGIPLGGKMPPFRDKLSDGEIDAVIAYFQSLWGDDIYNAWKERGGLD